MRPISHRQVLRAGWQPQDDGSYVRTFRPIIGDRQLLAIATATDGHSPVTDFRHSVRLVVRNATGELRQTRFFPNFHQLNVHVTMLETDTLVGLWLAH